MCFSPYLLLSIISVKLGVLFSHTQEVHPFSEPLKSLPSSDIQVLADKGRLRYYIALLKLKFSLSSLPWGRKRQQLYLGLSYVLLSAWSQATLQGTQGEGSLFQLQLPGATISIASNPSSRGDSRSFSKTKPNPMFPITVPPPKHVMLLSRTINIMTC